MSLDSLVKRIQEQKRKQVGDPRFASPGPKGKRWTYDDSGRPSTRRAYEKKLAAIETAIDLAVSKVAYSKNVWEDPRVKKLNKIRDKLIKKLQKLRGF
jgi:hypothetical protein